MGSVLETFYILFKTDAGDVEEGVEKATGATDKLEESIGGADKGSAELGKKFNTLATKAVAAFGSVFAVTQLIAGARGVANQSTELGVLADILGESSAEITNWGRAVENMGGSSEAFQGTLRGLNASLTDALVGGPNDASKALGILGLSAIDSNGMLKSTLDLLPEIAGEFSKLTRTDALALGNMLGLDEGTILLMSQGEAGVRALVARQREMNVVTDQDTEALRLFNAKWNEYLNLAGDVGATTLVTILPALEMVEKAMIAVSDWVAGNGDLVITFFKGAAVVATLFAAPLIIAAVKFIAIGAAIAGVSMLLGLLIEDFQAFFSGQESAIGNIIEFWKRLASEGVGKLKEKLQPLVDMFEKLKEGLSFDISGALGGLGESLLGSVGIGQGMLASASGAPIQAMGAASAAGVVGDSNKSTTVNVGEVNIATQAIDAEGIAAGASNALVTQMQNAIDNSDDGIAA